MARRMCTAGLHQLGQPGTAVVMSPEGHPLSNFDATVSTTLSTAKPLLWAASALPRVARVFVRAPLLQEHHHAGRHGSPALRK